MYQSVPTGFIQLQAFDGLFDGLVGEVKLALTEARVRTAQSRERPYKLADSDGLHLLVLPTGTKRWRMNYRFLDKQRTIAYGVYPDLSLADARELHSEARKLLAKGIDPIEHRKEQETKAKAEAANTFAVIAKEYLVNLKKTNPAKKTYNKKEWLINDLINPVLGKKAITDIRPSEILVLLKDIEASGRLETAKRTRQTIGNVFQLAALTDRAPGDPSHLLRRQIKAPRHKSYPAVIRPDQFGTLLKKIDRYPHPVVRLALLFHAYTFTRPVELRKAQRYEIDLEDSVWEIPAERMKMRRPHVVPLSAGARGILAQMSKLHDRSDGYIFPSPRSWRSEMSDNTLNAALHSLGYKGIHCVHGFRSSASSILNGTRRHRPEVIEFQLAHLEENETKRAYNRWEYWDERLELMKDWGEIVSNLRSS